MHTYVHRVGLNGPIWTVINGQGRVLFNAGSLERAVDYSLWQAKNGLPPIVYQRRYSERGRWYAVQPSLVGRTAGGDNND